MSWLEEANFQMPRDHQCALVWVDACRHNKAFSKLWSFGCNSLKIQALEARCNHSYKHRSIAGVKEQGVYLGTLTAATCPGRHRKGQQNRFLPTNTAIALRNLQDHHTGALQAPDLRRSRNALFRRLVLSQARTPAASSRQALAALDA